ILITVQQAFKLTPEITLLGNQALCVEAVGYCSVNAASCLGKITVINKYPESHFFFTVKVIALIVIAFIHNAIIEVVGIHPCQLAITIVIDLLMLDFGIVIHIKFLAIQKAVRV